MTPYEEIGLLIRKMRDAKETLEGTDTEYFSKEQLEDLNKLSNEVAAVSFRMISNFSE